MESPIDFSAAVEWETGAACLWRKKNKRHPFPPETTVPNRATSRLVAPILALVAMAALLTGCIYHDGYPVYYGGYGYYGGHGGHHGYGRRDNRYGGDWNRHGGYYGGHHGHGRGHRGHWR